MFANAAVVCMELDGTSNVEIPKLDVVCGRGCSVEFHGTSNGEILKLDVDCRCGCSVELDGTSNDGIHKLSVEDGKFSMCVSNGSKARIVWLDLR